VDPERRRLQEAESGGADWRRWGAYLAERQWGTVREDYSADGNAWNYFKHDDARSRVYRWGEDGIFGYCDDRAQLCFSVALWNEADPILKERFFGLTNSEGNHGEDVKEAYWYLDATPTASYMRALYRYPQRAYPYAELVAENSRRGRDQPEYDLRDTGAFAENRFFDVTVEYGKFDPEDIAIRLTLTNHGPEAAPVHVLPTLWSRNTWVWGRDTYRPRLSARPQGDGSVAVHVEDRRIGDRTLVAEGAPTLLFTENETNAERLWGTPNPTPFVKDGINDRVVGGREGAVDHHGEGTKAALWYRFVLEPGETRRVRLRLAPTLPSDAIAEIDALFATRIAEADEFYMPLGGPLMTDEERRVQRQAFAGLLWCKQYYQLDVAHWLDGDPAQPPPPAARLNRSAGAWRSLSGRDVLSMPDSWEYPWFAAWDLAFHCLPLAQIDPDFAKRQLTTLAQVWYQHPNGQLPAYEWAFGDVNPPVHAAAVLRVYQIDRRISGKPDRTFLERMFLKLLLNFTWWVNRKDAEGRNVFEGGFLGLDNIGVFDRSKALPVAGHLAQADGTAWMGLYCLSMLAIALELARDERSYEDLALKFFEHFLQIAEAINDIGGDGIPLWDETDEFFYDVLRFESGEAMPLRVRSVVGLIPLLAVGTIDSEQLANLPELRARMDWFLATRPELASLVAHWGIAGADERRLIALVHGHRMKALLSRMLDPNEFLSDHGIRSLSRWHKDHPYAVEVAGHTWTICYEPAESLEGMFGGNSNWRGPIWFPINYLLIESLQRFDHYYGPDFKVEHPTGSGRLMTLGEVANDLAHRLEALFLPGADGIRPVLRDDPNAADPLWRDYVLFNEYFHGDTGAGLGAAHQTGWTALVAKLLEQTSWGGTSGGRRSGFEDAGELERTDEVLDTRAETEAGVVHAAVSAPPSVPGAR
jgi:hypothetical protein